MVKGAAVIKPGSERAYQAFVVVVVVFTAIVSFYPLLYVIASSLVTEAEFNRKGGFVLWPADPSLLAYIRVFEGPVFTHALQISLFRTIAGTLLTLVLTTVVAYVASRKYLPGRAVLIVFVLVTILFNGGMIPTFLVVRELHLLDSLGALIIPTLVDSFSVLVLKQFFENVPEEIEQSAVMDGVGETQLMLKIMVPMAAPAMAAIGLFIAVYHWNAWFDAFIYINDAQKMPLQLIIKNLLGTSDAFLNFYMSPDARVSPFTLRMAVVVLGTLPILCVYPFLQKYFTKGMFMGAVKG